MTDDTFDADDGMVSIAQQEYSDDLLLVSDGYPDEFRADAEAGEIDFYGLTLVFTTRRLYAPEGWIGEAISTFRDWCSEEGLDANVYLYEGRKG